MEKENRRDAGLLWVSMIEPVPRLKYMYRLRDIPTKYLSVFDLDDISQTPAGTFTEQDIPASETRLYSWFSTKGADILKPSAVLLSVKMIVATSDVSELDDWYEQEHIDMLAEIPGWRRSRRFRRVPSEGKGSDTVELLAIHEFETKNGLGGAVHKAAKSTPWRERVQNIISEQERELYDLKESNHPE